jgi:putative nucleotidyltransferase with HDIG domain
VVALSEYRKKVLINLLVLIIGVIVIFSLFLFFSVRRNMLIDAKENLTLSSGKNAEKFNSKLHLVQNTVDNLVIVFENTLQSDKGEVSKPSVTAFFENKTANLLYETGRQLPGLKTLYFYMNPEKFETYYNISFAYLDENHFERLRVLPPEAYDSADEKMNWFFEPLKSGTGIWIEPYYWEIFDSRILTYSSPAFSEGESFGVIGLDLAVDNLIEELNAFKIYDSGNAFLLNQSFQYIISPNHEPGEYFFDSETGGEFKAIGFNDTAVERSDILESSNYLMSYHQLENGWIMAVKVLKSEIFKPMRDFLFYIGLLTVFFIVVAVFIARKTAGFLSQPLEKIARSIGHFELNKKTELIKTGIDELDIISTNFKTMADSVNHSYEIIRGKNDELEEAYREVENSYQEIENLAESLEGILNLTSSISIMALDDESDYLKQILKMTMTILKNAKRGIILKYTNQEWHSVYHSDFSEEGVRSVMEVLKGEDIKELRERKEGLKRTLNYLYSPLKYADKLLGAILIGTTQEKEQPFSSDDRIVLDAFSNLAAAFLGIQQHLTSKAKFRESILFSMIKLVELHDPYTKGHSESVSRLSVEIAKQMNLSTRQLSTVKWSGLVHDIGKILIPKEILNKPGKLNLEEYELIKNHPEYGAKVLFEADEISEVANIVKYHHERWDGTGYPDGLKAKEIPLESRVICVADTYDAMVSDRPYRKGLAPDIAVEEILKYSGKQFDPDVVQAFLQIKDRIR